MKISTEHIVRFQQLIEEHGLNDTTKKILTCLTKTWEERCLEQTDLIGKDFLISLEILLRVLELPKENETVIDYYNTAVSELGKLLIKLMANEKMLKNLILFGAAAKCLCLFLNLVYLMKDIDGKIIYEGVIEVGVSHFERFETPEWAQIFIDYSCKQIEYCICEVVEASGKNTKGFEFYIHYLTKAVKNCINLVGTVSSILNLTFATLKLSMSHVPLDGKNFLQNEALVNLYSILPLLLGHLDTMDVLIDIYKNQNVTELEAIHRLAVEILKALTSSHSQQNIEIYFNEKSTENLFTILFNCSRKMMSINENPDDTDITDFVGQLASAIILASYNPLCYMKIEVFLCNLLVSTQTSNTLFLVVNCFFLIARTAPQSLSYRYYQVFYTALKTSNSLKVSPLQICLRLIVQGFYVCLPKKKRQELAKESEKDRVLLGIDVSENVGYAAFNQIEIRFENIEQMSWHGYQEMVYWLMVSSSSPSNKKLPQKLVARITKLLKSFEQVGYDSRLCEVVFALSTFVDRFSTNFPDGTLSLINLIKTVKDIKFLVLILLQMTTQQKRLLPEVKHKLSVLPNAAKLSILQNDCSTTYQKFAITVETLNSSLLNLHICQESINEDGPAKKKMKLEEVVSVDSILRQVEGLSKANMVGDDRTKIAKTINILQNLLK